MTWSKRFNRRLREHRVSAAIVTLLVIVTLIAWSRSSMDDNATRRGAPPVGDAVYTLEEFTWTLFNAEGELDLRVSANAMEHLPEAERAQFIAPRFTLFEAGEARWRGQAETAWADEVRRELLLQGSVLIKRSERAPLGPMTLNTERLRLYPDDKRIVSEVGVEIEQPGGQVRGTGMVLNLATETYQLKSDVEGHYAISESR